MIHLISEVLPFLRELYTYLNTASIHNCDRVHSTALHYNVLHCTSLYCIALYRTALHCVTLNFTVMHYTVPHCTKLPSWGWRQIWWLYVTKSQDWYCLVLPILVQRSVQCEVSDIVCSVQCAVCSVQAITVVCSVKCVV